MSFIAPILAVAGTGIAAAGQLQAGNAAEAAAKNNAAVAVESAGIQEQQQRLQDRITLAHARSVVGASGVELSGSPLAVMAESARNAEMNALIIRRQGQLDANSQLIAGQNAQIASRIKAGSTILTGGYEAGKQLSILGKTKATVLKNPKGGPTYGDAITSSDGSYSA